MRRSPTTGSVKLDTQADVRALMQVFVNGEIGLAEGH